MVSGVIEKQYLDNGSEYEGEISNTNAPHGKGKIYVKDKLLFDGNWRNGLICGLGRLFIMNKKIEYDGEWKNNMRNGKGQKFYKNGN